MNIKEKRYLPDLSTLAGAKVCIHMQKNEKSKFYIATLDICPKPYTKLQNAFAEAILNS